jgi:peptidoglycan/xylan/chitin deacetylase (PgdA/CDA1 family)
MPKNGASLFHLIVNPADVSYDVFYPVVNGGVSVQVKKDWDPTIFIKSTVNNQYWTLEVKIPLKEMNVKATFFVGGMWATENEEYLQRFLQDGHEIGNHGYFHKDHTKLSLERNEEEIFVTHKLIKGMCGIDMNLFAPPSGAFDDATLKTAEKLGYKTIMWSKDTIDWRDQDAELLFARATKNPQNGDFILMHPTEATKNVLKRIISFYLDNGFNLCGINDCLGS